MFSGDDDDIYIEATTGDQGEALFKQGTSESGDKSLNLDISFDDIIKNPAFEIFVGIIAAALGKAGQFAYKNLKIAGD